MWKDIVRLFKSEGALQEAYDEAILMLRASHSMFDDSVAALHAEGTLSTDTTSVTGKSTSTNAAFAERS